jgi:hypothetical protein
MKIALAIILGIPLFFAAIFGLNYYAYGTYNFFAPKYEATRRDVMLQSRAYSEGETRNLYRLKIQSDAAPTPEARQTLVLAARHECEALDRSRLPADLASFCNPMGN